MPDTKCQKHYRSALEKSGLPVIGVFIPKCTENGSYAEVQCHPSTGYCWCSTKDGDKIPGTSKRGKRDCDEGINIRIMPFVEGDRSDCQPEANSIAQGRKLRVVVVVKG